ncbi:hypothetical protein DL89DRAFT_266611 [Linderina pennispora]|uniref:RNI-like protein n=1 Tax=Linderina pennispora TaxID=61395 RepID=A0A1Y1WEM3_9FUNG|nr:uncharacterized protein DL89DRAFT_266611 [Linderina pennispora]ORX71614.1 hypothetical protein DL89DRAFT_266611 [Linderina pennispora]
MPSAILFQQLFIDMLVAELLTPAPSGSTCTDATQPLRSLQPFAGTLSISIRKPTSLQRSQHLFHVASTAPGSSTGCYRRGTCKGVPTCISLTPMSAQQWPCVYFRRLGSKAACGSCRSPSESNISRQVQIATSSRIYNGFRKVMMEPALTALTLDINGRLHDFAMLPLTTAATLRSLTTHAHRRTRTLPVAVFAELECLDIHLIHVSSPAIGRAVSLLPAFHASPLHTLRLLNTDASLLPFDQRDFPRLCSLDVALRYLPSHELHTLEGLPQALLAHSNLRIFEYPKLFGLHLSATVASDAATEIVGQLPFLKTLAYQIDAGRSGRRLARREVVEMVAGGLGSTPLNMRLQKLGVVAAAEVLRLAARVPSLLCLEMGHGRVFESLKVLRDALGDPEIKSICV